jgi:hypothetical protein
MADHSEKLESLYFEIKGIRGQKLLMKEAIDNSFEQILPYILDSIRKTASEGEVSQTDRCLIDIKEFIPLLYNNKSTSDKYSSLFKKRQFENALMEKCEKCLGAKFTIMQRDATKIEISLDY